MDVLKKTALYEQHISLKAKMVPFAQYEMPIQYSSIIQEVKIVRESVGIFDVGHMGEFFVTGNEASHFVDYLISNRFIDAPIGKAVYSPLCRENGTIIDDLIAYKINPKKILLCVNASNTKKDWEHINSIYQNAKFDCEIKNLSDNFSLLALQGPMSENVLKQLLPEHSDLILKMGYYSTNEISENLIIARTGYTGEDGFEIFCAHDAAVKYWKRLLELKCTPCGLGARDVLRTEVCYPLYGHELSDEITPIDTGLKWTVDLSKKAFVGKNSLEGYQARFKLVRLSIAKLIPRAEYLVFNDNEKPIGKVTSGTFSPTLEKGIALALINYDLYPKNKKFMLKIREKFIPAEFHEKPFFKGGHK